MVKVYSPEDVDKAYSKVRAFSTGEGKSRWDEIKGLYTETTVRVEYDGSLLFGLEGCRKFMEDWAPRKRFTNGWQERILMIAEDISVKFYRYSNRGSDENGEPWDFMAEGLCIMRKNEDGSWQILMDVPWCGTNELVGKIAPTSPWKALLDPIKGDCRFTEGSLNAVDVVG